LSNYEVIKSEKGIVKAWKKGVHFEEKAVQQLINTAKMPFIYKWIAAMPDTHFGMGATVGTVLPTRGAVIPAAVGVDIGCGMDACHTDLKKADLGDLRRVREAIEASVPCGRTNNGGIGDIGAWSTVPKAIQEAWDKAIGNEYLYTPSLTERYESLCERHPEARAKNTVNHLGTLGTGNHFIELSEDEDGDIWIVLHSGSRGLGNKIGQYFTSVAKKLCEKWFIDLPDRDLAYLPQGTQEFDDYKKAVELAQEFALVNRRLMIENIHDALRNLGLPSYTTKESVSCHHNYVAWENHFGQNVIITRKGAVRARLGDMGIIPGSMGARSYIVRGLGNVDSFCSCSHGAGRAMSRTEAIKTFAVEDHVKATEGIECIKDSRVLDETPAAYKPIEAVMEAQSDLVEIVHTLKQCVNVKGVSDSVR